MNNNKSKQKENLGDAALAAAPAVAVAAAEASGFGVYMGATTLVHTVASAVGVSLPFAAYTGLTATMGVILGPVGWVGTGLVCLAIYKHRRKRRRK